LRFARVGNPGAEQPVLVHGESCYSLAPVTDDINADFWTSDGPRRAAQALEAGSLEAMDVQGLRLGAPITRPSSVICVGMNYAAHAAESGSAPPTEPIIFHKAPNTVVGPNDPVAIPRGSSKTDWEVELGVVIGNTPHTSNHPMTQSTTLAALLRSMTSPSGISSWKSPEGNGRKARAAPDSAPPVHFW